MATLTNPRKLAAVSRETPENTRNNQLRNAIDPEMAQEYISQASEEIEVGVTRNSQRKSVGESLVSCVPCPSLTIFFRTHKFGHVPQPFQEHLGTATWKTGKPLGIVP